MADHFFGTDLGDEDKDAVSASSSPTKQVEIVYDNTANMTYLQFKLAVERCLRKAQQDQIWEPS